MLKIAVGHSNDPDTGEAIIEVLQHCQQQLADGDQPQAGILLAAIDFEFEELLEAIAQQYPDIELIGGTTDGEISSVLGFEQDSVSLMLFCSDTITIRSGIGQQLSEDVDEAVQSAVKMASRDHDADDICLGITLYEGLTASGSLVLNVLQDTLEGVPLLGGLTADQWRFKQTYQFYNGTVYSDALTLLLFSGPLAVSFGVNSGWRPIGKAGTVTKQGLNVVYEIDNRPALEFYRYYLGDNAVPSSEYPLAVFEDGADSFYLRAPSGTADLDVGSVTFFGEVPLGAKVQVAEASRNEIVSAAKLSMEQALSHFTGAPSAAIYFSCASRRQMLGTRTCEESKAVEGCCDRPIPSFGFYTNGEISPLGIDQPSRFHNETFVTLLLGEK